MGVRPYPTAANVHTSQKLTGSLKQRPQRLTSLKSFSLPLEREEDRQKEDQKVGAGKEGDTETASQERSSRLKDKGKRNYQ